MNKWVKKRIIPLILLLLLSFLPLQALAAGESVTAQIPFTVENVPGTLVMEAVSEGAPSPDQPVFENTTEGAFRIAFTKVGDYRYRIYQRKGTEPGISYDTDTVYEVGISVVYDNDGGLRCEIGISKEESAFKVSSIVFNNASVYAYLDIQKVAKSDGKEIEGEFNGEEFIYEIKVENRGQSAATDVVIIDALPVELPLLEVVKTKISDGGVLSDDGKYITWAMGKIDPGDSVTVTFAVHVPRVWEETAWINTTAAIYGGGNPLSFGFDRLSGMDVFDDWFRSGALEVWISATATATATATSTATATVAVPTPNVIIEKEQSLNGGKRTKDIIDVNLGDTVTYYLTITNNSEAVAEDVVITDDIPAPPMLKLNENTISHGGQSNGSTITWKLGDLEAGRSVTLVFEVTVPEVSGYTRWVNQAFGDYAGVSVSQDASSDRIGLISNPVEVQCGTPPSSTPEPGENPTLGNDNPGTSGGNKPGTPVDNNSGMSIGNILTGDNSQIAIWIILIIISLTGLVVFFITERKRRNKRV